MRSSLVYGVQSYLINLLSVLVVDLLQDRDDRKHRDEKKNQAQAQLNVKKREGSLKKAEKDHEDKACCSLLWGIERPQLTTHRNRRLLL